MSPMTLGRISSYYYITHNTVRMFQNELRADSSIPELIEILSVSMCKQAYIFFLSPVAQLVEC